MSSERIFKLIFRVCGKIKFFDNNHQVISIGAHAVLKLALFFKKNFVHEIYWVKRKHNKLM